MSMTPLRPAQVVEGGGPILREVGGSGEEALLPVDVEGGEAGGRQATGWPE